MMNPSFLGRRFGSGVHLVLVRKLRLAETHLLAQSAYGGMTPVELGRALGITQDHRGARPNAQSGGMHAFGLACDIEYAGNPWIAGQHIERDKATGDPTEAGATTEAANAQFSRAVNRAALLVSGARLNFTAAYLDGLKSRPTAEIHDELSRRSEDLKSYLALSSVADFNVHASSRRQSGALRGAPRRASPRSQ